nr:hypothetical protein BaRGS_015081 [Batillaria attramentaria]
MVFSNSPAEGELQRGDLILAIGGREGQELTHKQAQDLIKFGGGQIQLVIQRPAPGRVQSTATFKPQRPRAPSLQQPPASQPAMPAPGAGFQPKKVTLSRLGGGGPEFGADFTSYRPSVTQPVSIQTRGPPGQHADMLNRVQESLDNISLSPRTPDYYQYIPTGVRLDMEREQEMRNQQMMQQQQQQQQQQYQPAPPSYQQQQSYEAPYTPTFERLEQQGHWGEEEEEEVLPVHERRKAFMNAPCGPAGRVPVGGGQQDGPNVVHLQYNTPIGLYSKENVQETYAGQTKALAAGAPSPGGTTVQNPAKPGDRDWTQSAVYRMIYEEEHRGQRIKPQPQQQQQQPQQQQPQQQHVCVCRRVCSKT